ncbi:HAD family phosphatase [Actinopolyspora erythraea]|uniref:HAD family phosphatase n=1 Tax=Actinopolyspora erythraea TaxID=414996 RepID=A0A099D7M5_9ACTN|nr:HAD family phosphatase [Actinopolyspora erythraea]ASU80970.1 HAD family phosphatase [Actinopolyspora erythraea]KGI81931.1 haloacid dehalogenase [Actinopolyspora erythraea]
MRTEPAITTVVFDYGGVLTTPGRTAVESWTHAEGIRPESFSAVLKEWVGHDAPDNTPIHRLETGELSLEEFDRMLAERLRQRDGRPVVAEGLLSRMFSFMRPDEEMMRLVTMLRRSGRRTGLLSNSWGNSYPWQRLSGMFDHVVVSGEVGMRKPDPRIYRLALERLEVAPERALFVDDVRANVATAEELGMHTILHRDATRTRARIAELVPDLDTADQQE